MFLDELPWIAASGSGFLPAFEHFWNGWGSARKDLLLIVCGSATSWISNKLLRNKGGLFNRITARIHLLPFTLRECEEYLLAEGFAFSRFEIVECHMIFGGIPFYLSLLNPDEPFAANVDRLCFSSQAALADEFRLLMSSLFGNPDGYVSVVRALNERKEGLTRDEILAATGLSNGGGFSGMLAGLENCNVVAGFGEYGNAKKLTRWKLMDPFTLFLSEVHVAKPYTGHFVLEQAGRISKLPFMERTCLCDALPLAY